MKRNIEELSESGAKARNKRIQFDENLRLLRKQVEIKANTHRYKPTKAERQRIKEVTQLAKQVEAKPKNYIMNTSVYGRERLAI